MSKLYKWLLAAFVALALAYVALVHLVMPSALEKAGPLLGREAGNYINGTVKLENVQWPGSNYLVLNNVTLSNKAGDRVATLPRSRIYINPFMLLAKEPARALTAVVLERPSLDLRQESGGDWNITNLLKPSKSDTTPFYGTLRIEDGRVGLKLPQGQWEYTVNGTVDGKGNPTFAVDMEIGAGDDRLKVEGGLTTKGVGALTLKTDSFDLAPYAPLAAHYGKVEELHGKVAGLRLRWTYDGKDSRLDGKGRLEKLGGVYEAGGERIPLEISGPVTAADKEISVKDLDVRVDGQKIGLSGYVDLADRDNVRSQLKASAETLRWKDKDVRQVSLLAQLRDKVLTVADLSFSYGEGSVHGSATYELDSGKVTGATELRKIAVPAGAEGRTALVNAVLALSGRVDREKKTYAIQAAAEAGDIAWNGLLVKVTDLDVLAEDGDITLRNFSGFAGDGAVEARGFRHRDGALELTGRVGALPLAPFLTAAGENGSGTLTASFHATGAGEGLTVEADTHLRSLDLRGFHVNEGDGSVAYRDGRLVFDGYRLEMDQGESLLKGSVDLRSARPALDLSLATENVRLEPLMAAAGVDSSVKITGNLDNTMTLTGTPENLRVEGALHMYEGSAAGYLVDDLRGRYLYENGALDIMDARMTALSTTLTLSGRMNSDRSLHFTATADNVDLQRLPIQDDDVALTGFASLEGELAGTLDSPLFSGAITSDHMTVNGVAVDNLAGTLRSNGKDINVLKARANQPGYEGIPADFKVDLSLDRTKPYLQGSIDITGGSLRTMLEMGKMDYPVDGMVVGNIGFNKKGPGTGATADAHVYNLKIHDVPYDEMVLQAHIKDRVLHFDNVRLQESSAFNKEGFIAVGGQIDFRNRTCQVEAGAIQADPSIITAFMEKPVPLTGTMDVVVQVSGSLDNPVGNGSLKVEKGSVAGLDFDLATAMLTLQDDHIRLEQFLAQRETYKLTAGGDIPLDLFRAPGQRKDPKSQMDITVDFNQASLAVLSALQQVEWGLGDTHGQMKVAGTLEAPMLYGNLTVQSGALKLAQMKNLIDDINVDVAFNGSDVLIRNVSATLGDGTVEGSGTYALRAGKDQAYSIKLHARNAQVDSAIFQGRINGIMEVAPSAYQKKTENGMETLYRPKVTANVRLDDVMVNMPTIPEFEQGNSNIGLDIIVKLGPKIHFYNKYLYDMWLSGDLHVLGSTEFPNINGMIFVDRGTITYLRTPFKIQRAFATWTEYGSVMPTILLNTTTRFSRYRIQLDISGPLEQMDMKLTSDPPLSKDELIRLLTLQRISAGGDDRISNEDLQNILSLGLQMEVLGDVERMVQKTLGIDEFKLYVGKLENGVDFDNYRSRRELTPEEREQYNFLVSKNLFGKWKVGYTRSFDGKYSNIFTQYQMTDHLNFTLSRSEKNEKKYSMEYRISF